MHETEVLGLAPLAGISLMGVLVSQASSPKEAIKCYLIAFLWQLVHSTFNFVHTLIFYCYILFAVLRKRIYLLFLTDISWGGVSKETVTLESFISFLCTFIHDLR